jgi:hypothetical protein
MAAVSVAARRGSIRDFAPPLCGNAEPAQAGGALQGLMSSGFGRSFGAGASKTAR